MREASNPREASEKRLRLQAILRGFNGVIVAFSGGVDSAYLLSAAHEALGDRCVGATAVSPSLARDELETARRIAAVIGARWIPVETHEFDDPRYRRNDAHRCYFCKHALFEELEGLAGTLGVQVIAYGANVDDQGDYRPGARAAAEFMVRAPLLEAGLTKAEIRLLARQEGLAVWDKPASPCLASRLPFGTPVTLVALRQIEESERLLHTLGFREVRVRHHGETARIEVPLSEVSRLMDVAPQVTTALRALGFQDVMVAQDGLRSGRFTTGLVAPQARSAPEH